MKVSTNPKIKVYQLYSFMESILEANHKDYEDWFVMNHNQLGSLRNSRGEILMEYLVGTTFGLHHLIEINNISQKNDRQDKELLHETLVGGLNDDQAWYIHADHYYLPWYPEYQKNHVVHDILIYDYDENADAFTYMEFAGNEYKTISAEWDMLFEALSKHDNTCFHGFRVRKELDYKFDIDKFITILEEYLLGKAPSDPDMYYDFDAFMSQDYYGNRKEMRLKYGIDTYESVSEHVRSKVRKGEPVDYHTIFLMLEHKANMVEKVEYLCRNGYLTVEQKDELLRSLKRIISELQKDLRIVMKYDFTLKPIPDGALLKNLDEIYNSERKLFTTFIGMLKKYRWRKAV